jgi:sulfate transport system ATP-binding protein
MSITVTNLSKSFAKFDALREVSLNIREGELVAILGPSGSGKTTLLRIIAGLESPTSGSVSFADGDVTNKSARDRQVGFVFQHYALFRHMTVFENIAFGLRVRPRRSRPSKAEITETVTELLRMVQLENMARRFPSQLSGGQRQRVALARALAVRPKLLLLDEPFGALDAKVRQELRTWLRKLHDDLGITSVFVTHDQEEALEVADRIVVMNQGRIEQIGTPDDVYDNPISPFVFEFLGSVNLFHGRATDGDMHVGDVVLHAPGHVPNGSRAVGYVRPHEIEILRQRNGATIPAVVRQIASAGPTVRLELEGTGGEPIKAVLTKEKARELALKVGEEVHVKPQKMQVFAEDYSI